MQLPESRNIEFYYGESFMLLVIDPDVFVASLSYIECQQVLNWVADHLYEYELVLDREQVLEEEYLEFLVQHLGRDIVAVQILQQLDLFGPQSTRTTAQPKIKHWPSKCPDQIQSLLNLRGCKSPIEQRLICMSTHAPKRGLTLLLTNPQDEYPRKLHQLKFKEEICKVIPKLRVVYASDSEVAYPSLDTRTKDDTDRLFEMMAEYVIREHYDCPHCYPHTPARVDEEAGEVDIYGYEREEEAALVIRIWVGECKLRRVNEDKLITTSEVRQLAQKWRSIKAYEEKRRGGPVEIHTFMISNAKNMEADAWKEAAKIKNFRFLSTRLISNWQKRGDWRIVEVEEFEPLLVGSSWQAKRLQTFNLEAKI